MWIGGSSETAVGESLDFWSKIVNLNMLVLMV